MWQCRTWANCGLWEQYYYHICYCFLTVSSDWFLSCPYSTFAWQCVSRYTGCFAINDHFTVHPTNQAATFGELVRFECRVSSCNHFLTFLVNGRGLGYLNTTAPDAVLYIRQEDIEVECKQDQNVGTLPIIVNSKTLEAVEYISCNWTVIENGILRDISSNKAHIVNITYPYQLLPQCPTCPSPSECANLTNLIPSIAHKEQHAQLYMLSFIVMQTIIAHILLSFLGSCWVYT